MYILHSTQLCIENQISICCHADRLVLLQNLVFNCDFVNFTLFSKHFHCIKHCFSSLMYFVKHLVHFQFSVWHFINHSTALF